jgi:hypothetical protein
MNINAYLPPTHCIRKIIFKDYCEKEVDLANTIKSCLRDDKLTLQGIEEERDKARKVLDITKLCNLGLLSIFINENGKELARLQLFKQLHPNAFENEVVKEPKDKTKWKTERVAARITAVADTLRLFAESDIQFVKDDYFERFTSDWIMQERYLI